MFGLDPVLIIKRKAILNNLGHPSRRSEIDGLRQILIDLKLQIFEMKSPALCDGGDVLVTGFEIIVGLSTRTNEAGVEFIRKTFPEFKVRAIEVEAGLHLKSAMSALDEETLVVSETDAGQKILAKMMQNECPKYKVIRVPDLVASNVLRIRNCVLVQEGFPNSEKILKKAIEERELKMKVIRMSEFVKLDGALTCCSVPLKLE